MFSQKKSFFKGKFFYILLVGIFVFGFWMNQEASNKNPPEGISAESRKPVDQEMEKSKKENTSKNMIDSRQNTRKQTTTDADMNSYVSGDENTDGDMSTSTSHIQDESYYLVKVMEGVIKIFRCDTNGNEEFVRNTEIDYYLLNEQDQALFRKGVVRYTKEELNELLQDFES